MQRPTTFHLENKKRKDSLVGVRWSGGMGLHTIRSIAQILLLGTPFNVRAVRVRG
jgi:hypothetical protein